MEREKFSMHVRPQPMTPTGVPDGSSINLCRLSSVASASSATASIPCGSTMSCTSWMWKKVVTASRHGRVFRARNPVGEVLDQDPLDLDGELILELCGELIQLRPRALDEEDGHLLLRPRASPREQRVREILDRHVLRRCEIHDPLQDLLTLHVLRLD